MSQLRPNELDRAFYIEFIIFASLVIIRHALTGSLNAYALLALVGLALGIYYLIRPPRNGYEGWWALILRLEIILATIGIITEALLLITIL
ncbi:hypothetical protein [Vulcanisaeta sp. JCM 16159]|uniref:hypothetical protein n=1 Tax=Vulcanisaeta sp. JCM 16159 TaxID=1295371 RepID=UPI0006CFE513|nr:hypothetical protein [Vulcanisaeta sp. JCM 16159]